MSSCLGTSTWRVMFTSNSFSKNTSMRNLRPALSFSTACFACGVNPVCNTISALLIPSRSMRSALSEIGFTPIDFPFASSGKNTYIWSSGLSAFCFSIVIDSRLPLEAIKRWLNSSRGISRSCSLSSTTYPRSRSISSMVRRIRNNLEISCSEISSIPSIAGSSSYSAPRSQ